MAVIRYTPAIAWSIWYISQLWAKKKSKHNLEKLQKATSPDMGLEPMTLRLKVWCSTDWANRAAHKQPCGINEDVH